MAGRSPNMGVHRYQNGSGNNTRDRLRELLEEKLDEIDSYEDEDFILSMLMNDTTGNWSQGLYLRLLFAAGKSEANAGGAMRIRGGSPGKGR
jgi:hypothetical protein